MYFLELPEFKLSLKTFSFPQSCSACFTCTFSTNGIKNLLTTGQKPNYGDLWIRHWSKENKAEEAANNLPPFALFPNLAPFPLFSNCPSLVKNDSVQGSQWKFSNIWWQTENRNYHHYTHIKILETLAYIPDTENDSRYFTLPN